MSNIMNLSPVFGVALGALIALAAEPFLKDENKHKVLPWVATFFIAIGATLFAFVGEESVFGLYAVNSTRTLLGLAVLLSALLGVAGVQWTLGHEKFKGGEAYGLLLLATCGALLMTQATDFLALFIGMELASFPIYALVGIRRKEENAGEGVFKYFVSGAIFSAIYLYGVSLIYGATGSTHIGATLLEGRSALAITGSFLVIFALLFKAGAAPFHYWVADVYNGASVAVTAFMAAVVKVGALAALATVLLAQNASPALTKVILIVSILSMVIGAFSGLAQKSIRRILAFSAVMNAGFMVIGFVSSTVPMYFFLITYAIGSAGALTGIAYLSGREDRRETLDDIQGLGRKRPFVALGVVVCLASLAGLPPAAGFLAKLTLFTSAFAAGHTWVAVAGFALSLVAAVYYLRIAYALFAPKKCGSVCEVKACPCACSAPYSYLLKFAVALAAIVLLVLGVIPQVVLA